MAQYEVSATLGNKSFTQNVEASSIEDAAKQATFKFDIFGPNIKDGIKVGYISPERGYIEGLSICEANDYAKLNPGTQFIFKTRDRIDYLNINEVNKLTADDLPTTDNCVGITIDADCSGPAKAYFYGGGGVGALGNPVIGEDGSVLAVDLVSGGFGYQYPPIVEVADKCGIAAPAVLRAELGEVAETVEYYDQESDFEEYDICLPSDVGYGKVYDVNGKEIGDWDPSLYANVTKDPIRKEIEKYQKFLSQLPNPWWTTRKYTPLKLTSDTKVTRTKFDVTDASHLESVRKSTGNQSYTLWNDFMNSYAISPVAPSTVKGSDYAGIPFTFEWEEDFPYDGEYVFKGLCDSKAEFYLDNVKIADLKSYNDSPEVIKKNIKSGVHRIRLDILNSPVKEIIPISTTPNLVDVSFSVYGQGAFKDLLVNFVSEDGKESFVINGVTKGKKTRTDVIKVRPNVTYKVVAKEDSSKYKSTEQGIIKQGKKVKEGGIGTSNKIFADYIGSKNDNDDLQITASTGIFASSNKRKAKGSGRSTYDLTFKVEVQTNSSQNQPVVSNQSNQSSKTVFNTVDFISKANRSLWRTNPIVGSTYEFLSRYGVLPFDPNSPQAKTESFGGTHNIVWDNIDFPTDGNYVIEVMVDDSVTLYIEDSQGQKTTIQKNGYTSTLASTGKLSETKFFKSGKYKITADLTQSNIRPFADENPMALAVNIQSAITQQEVISAKTWIENPMGVALIIDAPNPPAPKEIPPEQKGRCPNNPIWTTRFPSEKSEDQRWYPVRFYGKQNVTETIETQETTEVEATQEVLFSVYGEKTKGVKDSFKDIGFIFTATDDKSSFFIKGVDKNSTTRVEKIKIKTNVNYTVKAFEDSARFKSVEQGLVKNGIKSTELPEGTSNNIFADYLGSSNDNDDIQITASVGTFTASNRRQKGGRSTYDLTFKITPSTKNKQNQTRTIKTETTNVWSQFMNRYAISPVPPLNQENTDGGGVVYKNSWKLDIPYAGYYALRGTRDNSARVLIDGKEISRLNGYDSENPESKKVFLTKGSHKIEIELENEKTKTFNTIDKKIFDTRDWVTPASLPTNTNTNNQVVSSITPKFIQKGKQYFLEVSGSGSGEISFVMDISDSPTNAGLAAKSIIIPSDKEKITFARSFTPRGEIFEREIIKKTGTFTAGKTYGPIQILGASNLAPFQAPKAFNNKLSLYDILGKDENIKLTIADIKNSPVSSPTTQSTTPTTNVLFKKSSQNGLFYDGPKLASYRTGSLGPFLTPAFSGDSDYIANFVGKTWTLTWKNVDFPEDGRYDLKAEADDELIVKLDGVEIARAKTSQGVQSVTFNATKGRRTLELVLRNADYGNEELNKFQNNPLYCNLVITKKTTIDSGKSEPWTKNPIGVSAILIPPPCPKLVKGKGVITKIYVDDPGGGYPSPPPIIPGPGIGTFPGPGIGTFPGPGIGTFPIGIGTFPTYPVTTTIVGITTIDPGINYDCGKDKIKVVPDYGAKLSYSCDAFGRITKINVDVPGLGFPVTPEVVIETKTGVNFKAAVQLEVIRDPIVADPTKLIQVTDLVGLKQTGYVDGRPYYGSIFYKDGIKYAGFYETPGDLVQIYDTLQESILGRVTTPPSAIQRQGTDVTSNDPRLNIPGTPENLI